MIQFFTIYSLFFLVTALVSFFGAFLAWQRRKVKGALEIVWLMIASGTGAFWLIFETAAPTMAEKIFWSKMEFLGGISVPVLYFLFVLRFTGKDKFLTKKHIFSYFVIPIITFFLMLTNENHNLIWSGFSSIYTDTNLMEYYHGFFFWVGYVAYSYFLLIIATIHLFRFILHHKKSFRTQGWVILIGGVLPWSVSIFYLLGINVTPGMDITPASITISGILMIYAIFHTRFLDLSPIARETLFETLQDGILALDEQNRIQDVNEAAIKYLRMPGKNIIGLYAAEAGALASALLEESIKEELSEPVEIQDGYSLKTFRIIKQPIHDQPGSRLIVIRDITDSIIRQKELIKAKEKAEESDRLKSEFLANMSHEIRTPMSGILGFTELLRELKLPEDEQQEYLSIIEKSGTRMLNIINDIVNISRLETGLININLSEVSLNEQLDIVFKSLKAPAKEKGIRLTLKKGLSKDEALIFTDKEKICSILTNLANNAIKFTPSGSIEIGCGRRPDAIEFWVKDTGIGIPEDQKEFIFERFRQGSEYVAKNYEGAGLGLFLAKSYVELLGGKIWAESKEGKGSTFFFTIPCPE